MFPKHFGADLLMAIGQARDELQQPESRIRRDTLIAIQRAWGNRVYAARSEYLELVGRYACELDGATVIECGTGASTIVLALHAEALGFQVVSFEHDAVFRERIERAFTLDARLRSHVRIVHAPLVPYETYDWYDMRGVELSPDIGMVVCDGPPGSTRGGRFGALPRLRSYCADNAIILLDDTNRAAESRILQDWNEQSGTSHELLGPAGRFAAVRLQPR